jgi:hypothetical protein
MDFASYVYAQAMSAGHIAKTRELRCRYRITRISEGEIGRSKMSALVKLDGVISSSAKSGRLV